MYDKYVLFYIYIMVYSIQYIHVHKLILFKKIPKKEMLYIV